MEVVLTLNKIINLEMSFINRLLESLREEKIYSSFGNDIWGVDMADMQS